MLACVLAIAVSLAWPEVSFEQLLAAADLSPLVTGAEEALARRGSSAATFSQLPQLTLSPGQRYASGKSLGFEAQGGLIQQFSLSGAGASSSRADGARRSVREAEVDARRLEARRVAAGAWLEAWAARRRLELATETSAAAAEFRRRVSRLVEAKVLTEADLAEADGYVAELTLSLIDAEGILFEAGVELARVSGRDASQPVLAGGAPPSTDPASMALPARWSAHPELQTALREAEAARARVDELDALSGGYVQAGVLAQHEAPDNNLGLLTATIGLPVWDTHRHERNDAISERADLEARVVDAEKRVVAQAVAARHEVEHSREVREACEKQLVPAAERLAHHRARLLDAGEATVFEELVARRTLHASRTKLAEAQAREALARVRWKLLIDAMSAGAEQ